MKKEIPQGINEQEALDAAKKLLDLYFEKRDISALMQSVKENISWIGTGEWEVCSSMEQVGHVLKEELQEDGGSFRLKDVCLQLSPVSRLAGVVYGTLKAVSDSGEPEEESIRVSAIIESDKGEWKLLHIHFSHPDAAQNEGEYFIKPETEAGSRDRNSELDLRRRQLAVLNRNIPGGAHQCKNDEELTLISMSNSFLSMFGYNREEIAELFHNHFMEMVYPGDRALLLSAIHEQLERKPDIELEYRVMCKNSPPIWILDKGRLLDNGNGEATFFCLLIEITKRKQEQEELRLSLERHQIIVNQATDIIFEWDIKKDTLNFSPNWQKKFGYQAIDSQISERIPLSTNIYPEDIPAFVKIMKDTAEGVPYSETEFRIRSTNGKYYWCRIRVTTQFDSEHQAIKAVGIITDIEDQKKQTQVLLDMAQKDTLTGLYNKATVNSMVECSMQKHNGSGIQALFILDVDFFKGVNDSYGHLAGDGVLSNVAETIRKNIRRGDIAGRIGGDEFMVYLPDIRDEASAMKKAEKLRAELSLIIPEAGAPPISCSIGIATAPYGETDYQEFFKKADSALYARKNSGRGGTTLFVPSTDRDTLGMEWQPETRTKVDSDTHGILDERLAQYTFQMLYNAQDLQSTISRLLEIIGRSYDVSRTYIFESSPDGRYCSNTFEWCAEGVEPQMDKLQNIPYVDEQGDYQKNFDSNGLFHCADAGAAHPLLCKLRESREIRSMLQCTMMDEGVFMGYVGFDECRENRTWSTKQILSFKLTADVLSTFTIKLRQKQRQRLWEER